jgi:heat shock protein 4
MGFYFKKSRTFFEAAGMKSKEIVISVPSYATNAERQAYLDAAEIGGIKCIRLINESTATALTYGFFRKNDLDETIVRNVAFVDFGHSKLSITFAQFLKGKMKILYTYSDRNLGARQIDYALFDLLSEEFLKKHGCDPRESPRARLRLLDAIEKMRKLLTSNKETDVTCEALLEDEDLRRHFTRDELETLIEPSIKKFRECLEHALTQSRKQKIYYFTQIRVVGNQFTNRAFGVLSFAQSGKIHGYRPS